MSRFVGILGILTMLALAFAFSTNRRAIRLKTVGWGLGLQLTFAVFVLRADIGRRIFQMAGNAVNRLLSYAFAGSEFVFGDLGKQGSHLGFYFAFQVLPTVIFIAAFFAVLYHYGVMQFIIRQLARVMTRFMGASGAESLNVAASIFMGQTEAPLTIRPFLPDLTRSELMTVMTSGMAHVSGGIMAAYIAFGIEPKHLLSAVIMTAPGTILMAKMLVPETEQPKTAGQVVMSADEEEKEKQENLLGAIARGIVEAHGGRIWIEAVSTGTGSIFMIELPIGDGDPAILSALLNGILGGLHGWLAAHGMPYFPSSLERIFGTVFAPIAWVIGVPWKDCGIVGNLLGTRMALNELVAFSLLGPQRAVLDPRSFTIATFALCGFANLSSIGIQIGGIGALAPNKKRELASLGVRAMMAGTMANLISASIAGMLL